MHTKTTLIIQTTTPHVEADEVMIARGTVVVEMTLITQTIIILHLGEIGVTEIDQGTDQETDTEVIQTIRTITTPLLGDTVKAMLIATVGTTIEVLTIVENLLTDPARTIVAVATGIIVLVIHTTQISIVSTIKAGGLHPANIRRIKRGRRDIAATRGTGMALERRKSLLPV